MANSVDRLSRWVSSQIAWDVLKWATFGTVGFVFSFIAVLWARISQQPTGWVILLALVGFTCGVVLTVAYAVWKRTPPLGSGTTILQPPPTPNPPPLREVTGQRYEQQTLSFDGNRYINCVFKNCTILYDGGPTEVLNCTFEGGVKVATSSQAIKNYLGLITHTSSDLRAGKPTQISTGKFTLP